MVVVFFGGIGTYYFKVFQWRHLEEPLYDLLIVKNDDAATLNDFRKFTVTTVVDPARRQHDRLVKLRKSTNAATETPEEYAQSCKEIANSLRDLMNTAKLRRIPKQYEKKYHHVLNGLSETYKSLRALEAAMGEDLPDAKKRELENSIKLSKSASKNLSAARSFFWQ